MSFILDALKKSESDRQGKNRPESAYIPTGAAVSSPSRWLLFVGVLLLINVVVLMVVFLKPETASTDIETLPIVKTEEPKETDTFRDLVASARDREPESAPPVSEPAGNPKPEEATPRPVEQKSTPAAAPTRQPSTATVVYKTFNEVRANGTVQLPDLHLDLHVYNSAPAERFIFINMNKYSENATLSEGPLVTEIVPEGVILEHLGTRFLLPRE